MLLRQPGILRPMRTHEFSEGTLRFLMLVAALLTPRPPALMVLNEPEVSLHQDLIPTLAKLIQAAARHMQIWVITHNVMLASALRGAPSCVALNFDKELGQTVLANADEHETAAWKWPV